MSSILASRNPDFQKLVDEGFAVSLDSNCLVIRDIPYLDSERHLKWGALISTLNFQDNDTFTFLDHQMLFTGPRPCQMDGTEIKGLGGGPNAQVFKSPDLKVQHSFSHKLTNDAGHARNYTSLYEKVLEYVNIVSGPAIALYSANPRTFNVYEDIEDSIFKVRDTLSSRAAIGDLAQKFENEVVAVIGLGGTGSYLLDLLVKTPVKEIRGFDNDFYYVHNAYRSPGEVHGDDFKKKKAEVYQRRYGNFRHGLKFYAENILEDSEEQLLGCTFAFVCVDDGQARKDIFNLLIRLGISFIDVGMGLDRDHGPIGGMVRTTYLPNETAAEILGRIVIPFDKNNDHDVYRKNIQIAELNSLNACLAIIRYKQSMGFFYDVEKVTSVAFIIDSSNIMHDA